MKKAGLALAVALLLLPAFGSSAKTEDIRTLNGTYKWDQGNSEGLLEAVFTPITNDTWGVSFHFKFRGKPHTYSGTATGSLANGDLSGEVTTDDNRGTFTFEGKMIAGKFSGTHARLKDGKMIETGTLSLK